MHKLMHNEQIVCIHLSVLYLQNYRMDFSEVWCGCGRLLHKLWGIFDSGSYWSDVLHSDFSLSSN